MGGRGESVEKREGRGVRGQVGVRMVGKREAKPVLRRRIHVVDERERDVGVVGEWVFFRVFGNSEIF